MTIINENNIFTLNLDTLVKLFNTKKVNVVHYLIKNFRENIHFIIWKDKNIGKHGGHNKIIYLLTENTYKLIQNSYNLRSRYITNISDNINCVNIVMSLENSTIGFIYNCFYNIIEVKRQFYFGSYRVDLYFPEYNLIIECDENNHNDRNQINEKIREEYILSLGKTIIRYNPNDKNFELSLVINEINKILYKKIITTNVITINF